MSLPAIVILAVLFFAVALLYSTVGHAGASGYLAAMALIGVAPSLMQPTSLALNVVVASIAAAQFLRAGHFRWALFWPFAAASAPAACLGGFATVPVGLFRVIVGMVLVLTAWWMVRSTDTASNNEAEPRRPPGIPLALTVGGGIGLLAGLSGTGGGIFLSPVLLLTRWASVKRTAAIASLFILVNSTAGLAGILSRERALPSELLRWGWAWALAAAAGGFIGSRLGATRLRSPTLRRLLAAVLIIAGAKLILAR